MDTRRERLCACGMLVIGVVACADPDASQDGAEDEALSAEDLSEPATVDSAGIRIVESPGAAVRVDAGWEVDSSPDLSLGGPEAVGPEAFDGIRFGVGMLEGRRLFVLDRGASEVRLFDWEGDFVEAVGGEGAGPGEFRTPFLATVEGDHIAVFDRRGDRVTLFSLEDGRVQDHTSEVVDFDLPGGDVLGLSGGRALVSQNDVVLTGQPGPIEGAEEFLLIDLEEGERGMLERHDRRPRFVAEGGELGPVPVMLDVTPFAVDNAATLGGERVYMADPMQPEVREYDLDGNLHRIFRIDQEPREVTEDGVDEWIESYIAWRDVDDPDDHQRVFRSDDMPVPETVSTFQDLKVADEEWVWAELYRLPDEHVSRWLVFDPEGRAQGTVAMPPGFDVHEIGQDYVVGVEEDDLGVEYLVRYRLGR